MEEKLSVQTDVLARVALVWSVRVFKKSHAKDHLFFSKLSARLFLLLPTIQFVIVSAFLLSAQPMTDIQTAIKDRDGQLSEFLLSYEKLRVMFHAFVFRLDPL